MAYQKYCQNFLYIVFVLLRGCGLLYNRHFKRCYSLRSMAHLTPYKMAGVQNFVVGLRRKVGEKHLRKR